MSGGGWRFAEAEESHNISLCADPKYQLTGEPAGRQIWHQSPPSAQPNRLQEKTFRFNAAENPNSCDQLFRDQQLGQWAAEGKEVPDESIPETAREAAVKGLEFYQMLQCDDGHWAGDYGGK